MVEGSIEHTLLSVALAADEERKFQINRRDTALLDLAKETCPHKEYLKNAIA